ncbi:MAG: class I SAM-dependent methyltransferase [Acidobacteria bacterium]|nr:class I SAM-dependent methyltransferase [Acidobacteriota bacterium]
MVGRARRRCRRHQGAGCLWLAAFAVVTTQAATGSATAVQDTPTPGQHAPALGQEGKDVEWVPTPDALVQTMLAMAKVTPEDFVVDLGSGDGRTVIEAARLGARAVGVEYDAGLVALSRERAEAAGVGERARFVQADLFEADLTEATVVTLFLLPDLNLALRPRLLRLPPGTRVVSNTWDMGDWAADAAVVLDPCPGFCTALLWVVPAQVGGDWAASDGSLTLSLAQQYQTVSGVLRRGGERHEVEEGRLSGADLTFRAGGVRYRGRVSGDRLAGTAATGERASRWSARRTR